MLEVDKNTFQAEVLEAEGYVADGAIATTQCEKYINEME